MAKLIHSIDGAVIREFGLDKESTSIGRKAHNDIQIESPSASGEHARIVTLANDSFLQDLGSTNGTRVNGQSITKHILKNNDVIEIGNHRFEFVSDAAGSVGGDFEKTVVVTREQLGAQLAEMGALQPQGFFAKLKAWFKSSSSGR